MSWLEGLRKLWRRGRSDDDAPEGACVWQKRHDTVIIMLMASRVRALEPVLRNTGNWIQDFQAVAFLSRRREVSYSGRVLKPRAATGSRLEFDCRTTALRRARVRIPVCVNDKTFVKLFVDDHLVKLVTLTPVASGRFTLRFLSHDITRWTEAAESVRVQLQFVSENQSDSLFILQSEDQPQCRPAVVQRGGGAHLWKSACFFVLAWLNFLAGAIVVLAVVKIENESFGYYAVLVTCVVWLAGLLGLPDLANVPVRSWIRRLFGATHPGASGWVGRHRRELALAALVSVLAISSVEAARIVHTYWIRHRYTALVRGALQARATIDPAIAALKLAPWRREAQILIQRWAFDARSQAPNERFREVAAKLGDDPDVEKAVRTALSDEAPSYVSPKDLADDAVGNPVPWFASLLIEGESQDEHRFMDRAKTLVESAHDSESALLKSYFLMKTTIDGDVQERESAELHRSLESFDLKNYKTDTYLFLADFLFVYHLGGCEADEGEEWLKRELKTRSNSRGTELWFRPPEKFIAYYLFKLYGDKKSMNTSVDGDKKSMSPGEKNALETVDDPWPGSGLDKRCDSTFDFVSRFKQVAAQYPDLVPREGWLKNTVFESPNMTNYLEQLLVRAWRY